MVWRGLPPKHLLQLVLMQAGQAWEHLTSMRDVIIFILPHIPALNKVSGSKKLSNVFIK